MFKIELSPSTIRKIRKIFAPFHCIGLKKEASIFSNNCWAGRIYDIFGKQYLSPTIGLAINENDYIKFISNLDYYLNLTPEPIVTDNDNSKSENKSMYGKLGDLTLNFVHYDSVDDGISKWERRKKRIVFDNIIVKFSYTPKGDIENDELLNSFSKLNYKKILFTCDERLANRKDLGIVILFKGLDKKNHIIDEFPKADKLFPIGKVKELINR